jgi:hypothetical protein
MLSPGDGVAGCGVHSRLRRQKMKATNGSHKKMALQNLAMLGSIVLVIAILAATGFTQDQWPQAFTIQDGKISVYEPQLESYKGDKINGRAALSVQEKNAKEPTFGVAWFSARAVTDRDARMVEFKDIVVERIKFPQSTPEQEKKWTDVLSQDSGKWMPTGMELDRLLALTAAIERGKGQADRLNMNPPKIIFTTTPSALILINGKPELRKVENSGFERVINTPFLILFDPASSTYYTKGGDFWYTGTNVMGPWKNLKDPPSAVVDVAGRILEPRQNADADQPRPKVPPEIIVATEPTELIVSEGKAKFAAVQGTDLLYVSNTPSEVFLEVKSQQYYVLLAGRWYGSRSLEKGPWAYVSSENLPQDFRRIPHGSSKGHILAFVAGTTEAEEAVLDAQIPQTTAVKRDDAKLSVSYDGNPKFEPIKDTDMQYAVNTKTQVVKVGDKYYAVDQGVWYVSDSPTGPWVVADTIPPEIDTIPPDSPVYNVKYVRVYDSTPEEVYVGYTPGYLGSYVYGDTIVYGTGYYYPGWVGTDYYPAPVTWGYAPIYDPFYCSWGFGWGYGAGFVSGFFWGFPLGVVVSPWWYGSYWAGWYPWYGYGYGYPWGYGYGYGGYGYGYGGWYAGYSHYPHYGHGGDHPEHGYGGNQPGHPPSGGGHAQANINRPINTNRPSQVPGQITSGARPVQNTPRPGQNTPSRPGQSPDQRLRQTSPQRQENLTRSASPSSGTRPGQTQQSPSARANTRQQGNNIFAGRDGNVYRKTPQGWEQRTQGGWTRPDARSQTSQNFQRQRSGLDRDYSARTRGSERTRDSGRVYRGSGAGNPGRGGSGYGSPGGSSYRGGSGYSGGTPMGGSSSGGDAHGGCFGGGTPRGGGSGGRMSYGGGFGVGHGGGPRR